MASNDVRKRLSDLIPAELLDAIDIESEEVRAPKGDREICRRLRQYLARVEQINMPRLYPMPDEVRARQATRSLPSLNCKKCHGKGASEDGEVCECIREVTFQWSANTHHGAVACGRSHDGRAFYARLRGDRLALKGASLITDITATSLIVLAVVTAAVGVLLGVGRGNWLGLELAVVPEAGWCLSGTAILILPLAWPIWKRWPFAWTTVAILLLMATGWLFVIAWRHWGAFLDGGAVASELPQLGLLTVTALALAALLAVWFSRGTRSSFRLADPSVRTQAWFLLTRTERCRVVLSSWRFRIAAALVAIGVAFALLFPARHATSVVRGFRVQLLQASGRYEQATEIYEADGDAQTDSKRALEQAQRAQRLRLIGAESHLRHSAPFRAYNTLRPLATWIDQIGNATVRESCCKNLDACCRALMERAAQSHSKRDWEQLGQALSLLVHTFPDATESRDLGDRSRWFLEEVKETHSAPRILAYRRSGGENSYVTPEDGRKLMVIDFKMVHVGRTSKELTRASFSWIHSDEGQIVFHGFPTPDGLVPVKSFPEVRLGPESLAVETLWEVPATVERFRVTVSNRGMDVSLKNAEGN